MDVPKSDDEDATGYINPDIAVCAFLHEKTDTFIEGKRFRKWTVLSKS